MNLRSSTANNLAALAERHTVGVKALFVLRT
jgi:hypothetical protein